MHTNSERLLLALAAFEVFGSVSKTRVGIRREGLDGLCERVAAMSRDQRLALEAAASDMAERGIDALLFGDDRYPPQLSQTRSSPGLLFIRGNADLLHAPAVGMCGSRNVSESGLRAALVCGEEVASHGLTIVSGYAKGVDTQTHLAALQSGGSTVIVLAEGINQFRTKRAFNETGLPLDRVLIVSQFAPSQRWTVGGAMTRNGVIAGLAMALVVVEAGESGGTFNAGLQALGMNRPVLALDFASSTTPVGNQRLFERGALPIRTRKELGQYMDTIRSASPTDTALQLPLL